jgi:hypothetical protein
METRVVPQEGAPHVNDINVLAGGGEDDVP